MFPWKENQCPIFNYKMLFGRGCVYKLQLHVRKEMWRFPFLREASNFVFYRMVKEINSFGITCTGIHFLAYDSVSCKLSLNLHHPVFNFEPYPCGKDLFYAQSLSNIYTFCILPTSPSNVLCKTLLPNHHSVHEVRLKGKEWS